MPVRPFPGARVAALLAAALGVGCALSLPAQGRGSCFSKGSVVVPLAERVRPALSTGEAGGALYDAVVAGDRERAQALLAADPGLAATVVLPPTDPATDTEGRYGDLLTFAVAACDPAMVAALLEAGLPPDGVDVGQALTLALLADDLGMAALLLEAGASPDPQKRGGRNAFLEARFFGDPEPARLLLRHGLDLEWVDELGNGHLRAATTGAWRIAEALILAGDNPWEIGTTGQLPAHALWVGGPGAYPGDDAALLRIQPLLPRAGLPWPPPDAATVRARVASGEWPTPAMRAAGMTISPEALARLRERAAREGLAVSP